MYKGVVKCTHVYVATVTAYIHRSLLLLFCIAQDEKMMAHRGANYIRRCGQACNVQRYRHGKLSDKEAVYSTQDRKSVQQIIST